MQGTLYTLFNREMDYMVVIPLGYAPLNVVLLIHSYIERQQEVHAFYRMLTFPMTLTDP